MTVAVIIPAFNRAVTLPRALDSVLMQTRPADEIIVIDDGSTDNTEEVLADYPDVTVIRQANSGVSAARNRGIKAAGAEWIALLDSDDSWHPQKLEMQLERLEQNPGHRLCHTEEIWVRNGVRVNQMKKHQKGGGMIFHRCLEMCVISPSSALLHRTIFDEYGLFDETLPACEDYDLWLRFCSQEQVLYIDTPLITKYGGHEDQLSRQYWGMDRFRISALGKLLDSGKLNEQQCREVRETILKKAGILVTGGKKRGNIELVEHYQQIIDFHGNAEA